MRHIMIWMDYLQKILLSAQVCLLKEKITRMLEQISIAWILHLLGTFYEIFSKLSSIYKWKKMNSFASLRLLIFDILGEF